jgi:hypothetical protein
MYSTTLVDLTPNQKRKMLSQIRAGGTPSLHLSKTQLSSRGGRGSVPLPVTKTQLGKIQKARTTGKGLNLKFSQTHVKKGGFLPLLLPILAALGATAGGAAGIAKAVNDAKANTRQLEELKRHNATMEAVALRSGKGFKNNNNKKKKKKKKSASWARILLETGISMKKALTNIDLTRYAKKLGIRTFRGVFSKDLLPRDRRGGEECGIINLQNSNVGGGTHWTAYFVRKCSYYFDSFGLDPPIEMRNYLGPRIIINQQKIQGADELLCGQYCLCLLYHLNKGVNFFDAVNNLTR